MTENWVVGPVAAILEQRGRQRRVDDRGTFGILAFRSSREKKDYWKQSLLVPETRPTRTVWALAHSVPAVHGVPVNALCPSKGPREISINALEGLSLPFGNRFWRSKVFIA